jgi:hypothetical protein
MATQVTCWFTQKYSYCSHGICRRNHDAEQDWINSIKYEAKKSKQREYALKYQDSIKSTRAIWEIFKKRDISVIPPNLQEVYLIYTEGKGSEN